MTGINIAPTATIAGLRAKIGEKFELGVAPCAATVTLHAPKPDAPPPEPLPPNLELEDLLKDYDGKLEIGDKHGNCLVYVTVPPKPEGAAGGRKRTFEDLEMIVAVIKATLRPGPTLMPATVGQNAMAERTPVLFVAVEGADAAMSLDEMKEAQEFEVEKEFDSFMTPILNRIFEGRVVVNSEDYAWIQKPGGENGNPDFFVGAHPGVYRIKTPTTESTTLQALRDKLKLKHFGHCHWELRDSVFIGDSKLHITREALGEVLIRVHSLGQPRTMRSFLFDPEECWLLESLGVSLVAWIKVPWTSPGSLQQIRNFFPLVGWAAVGQLCEQLEVSIQDPADGDGPDRCTTSFLGSGACGRVFRVRRTDGSPGVHAMKAVIDAKHGRLIEDEFTRLQLHASKCECGLLARPTSPLTTSGPFRGYTMQPIGNSMRSLWEPSYLSRVFQALEELHKHGFVHGDPRLENLLMVEGNLVWIDLLNSTFGPEAAQFARFRDDATILAKSVLAPQELSPELLALVSGYIPSNGVLETIVVAINDFWVKRKIK